MLQLTDVSIAYEGETLLSGITFHVGAGERVALVGPNGAGKSSILKAISGEVRPAGGSVSVIPGRTVAYLAQDSYVPPGRTLHDEMLSVFADVLALEERQREVERRMGGLQGEDLDRALDEYARLHADFDRLDGYTIEREVGTVLHGLGFAADDAPRPVEHFSGGWRSRIALGKTLLRRPDLLLLDEPTNHLDLHATEWLEDFLANYSGSLMVVSHDRYFLERVTARTLELEGGRLTDYPGRYSWYIREKERRREAQQEAYERQQKELERQQVFIDRFRAKATKASAVKSREKMVARIERVEEPEADRRKVKFRFPFAGNSGRVALLVKDACRAYGEEVVISGVDLEVERGDKIGVIGPNGSGKSTLMRLLAGVDQPSSGEVVVGHNVRRSYFEQHQAELLESGHTVYDEVMEAAPQGWTVTDMRNLLGRFLFSGDDVQKPIEVLSGGERNRVALVKMLLRPANTLLLDEPTNHLDIPTRDVLEEAIREYEGACVVISHDRYFLDRVATKTLDIENGKVTVYPGNYSEYRERKLGISSPPVRVPEEPSKPQSKEQPRRSEKDLRKLRQEVSSLEAEIVRAEARLGEVQQVLGDPALYEDWERYGVLLEEHGELERRLQDLNSRWEQRAAQLEELEPAQPRREKPDGADSEAQRERLLERLREIDSLLEDPVVLADSARSSILMDEYAEVYESLAGMPQDGAGTPASSQRADERPSDAANGRSQPADTEDVGRVRVRLAELERMLMDSELFLDPTRSAPVLEEYGYLQEKLERLTAPARKPR